MDQALIETGTDHPLTAATIRAQVNRIQEVMKEVMQEGQHYGKVPGCGDKPTLLKPGAEKLLLTFQLAGDPEIEDLSANGIIRYRIRTRIFTMGSQRTIGYGVGEASSDEEKFAWRLAICDEEWADADPSQRREKWKRGYDGKPNFTIKQIRTTPADLANTILKMADKRSYVSGALKVTAASDIFTQDIEDMPEEVVHRQNTQTHGSTPPNALPFGKHKGKPLSDDSVPVDYLQWLLKDMTEKKQRPDLQAAISEELKRRRGEGIKDAKPESKLIADFKTFLNTVKTERAAMDEYKRVVVLAKDEDEQNEIMGLYEVRGKELKQ